MLETTSTPNPRPFRAGRRQGYDAHLDTQDTIFAALAHKRGQGIDQVRLDVEAKVAAKVKRDARG